MVEVPLPALKAPSRVLPARVPVVAPLPIWSVPSGTVAVPENVLVPVRMSVPLPVLARPPLPETTPEKVPVPVVSVPAPRVTLPAPSREATVAVRPLTSKVAPEETVRAVAVGSAPVEAPRRSVPVETVVVPVKVLTPVRVRMPAPCFTSELLPKLLEMTPA